MEKLEQLTDKFIETMNLVDRKNFFGKTNQYWNDKWCEYYKEAKEDFVSNVDLYAFSIANKKLRTLYKSHKNINDEKQLYLRW